MAATDPTDPTDSTGPPSVEAEKRVSWAELFFDLVFVFAVTQTSALLGADHTGGGLLRALIVFVPVYWLWVGTSIQANQQDISGVVPRLRVFAVALVGVFMAIALPDAYGATGPVFAVAYWVGRLVLGSALLRRGERSGMLPLNPYTISMVLTGPLLVVGSLLPDVGREVVWAVAAVIDLATPTLLRSRLRGMHFNAPHLAERFGLLVLIALGESVVAIGVSAEGHLDLWVGVAVAIAFVLSTGLWWVYFHFAADAVRHALATAQVQLDITRLVLSYGHLLFIAAVIGLAVGLHEAVAEPTHALSWSATGLLFGSTALYLAAFGFTRWTMFHLVSKTRLTAAAAVLVALPAAPFVPAVVALVLLALIVAVLNAVELRLNDRIGWRARRGS
jgi:low temperature requirement protein LtrA